MGWLNKICLWDWLDSDAQNNCKAWQHLSSKMWSQKYDAQFGVELGDICTFCDEHDSNFAFCTALKKVLIRNVSFW